MPRKSSTARKRKSTVVSIQSKQERIAHEFLRKQRLARERQEAEERFPFTPQISDEVDSRTLVRDAKRIRLYEESDNKCGLFSNELHGAINAMSLGAGQMLEPDVPLDIRFTAAMQKVSDFDLGRTIPTNTEWTRVGTLTYLWAQVTRTLDAIDELNKANRAGFEPSEKWFRSYRTVTKAA